MTKARELRQDLYEAANAASVIGLGGHAVEIEEGQLYKVDVPEDDELLAWDKPWSEQPETVKAALEQILPPAERRWTSPSGGAHVLQSGDAMIGHVSEANGRFDIAFEDVDGSWRNVRGVPAKSIDEAKAMVEARAQMVRGEKGEDIYRRLVAEYGSPEAASRALNERGVKGLRYLDQGSRGQGEGTYNFVIFDDAAIDVIETYYQRQPAARPRVGQGEARYVTRPDARYVTLESGSDTLGEITAEIAGAIGREAAPIRLPEGDARFGEAHIEARHGTDIRKAGYADAAELVADVAANFTAVHRGDRGRLILVRQNGRDRAAIVELRPAEDGAHWTVTTAGLFRPEYLARKELLWRQPGPAGAPPEGGSSFNPGSQSSKQRLDQGAPPGNAPDGAAAPPHEPAPAALPHEPAPGTSGPGLVPGLDPGVRAAVEIGADVRRILLGAKSDKTSFMHESAHVFLWLLRELGADAEAAPLIRQDWETIRDFLGAEDGRPLTKDRHERFAGTFERYLAEGKAPAPELEGAFARFKDWFLAVYRSLRDIAPDLAPDVRATFDKLLADGVAAGKARFTADPAPAGVPPSLPDPPAAARAASVDEIAAEHGVDLEGAHDAESALGQIEAEGGLLDAERAELAAADALVARAAVYERAYAAAAVCLSARG